jgi:hypothetical protein
LRRFGGNELKVRIRSHTFACDDTARSGLILAHPPHD